MTASDRELMSLVHAIVAGDEDGVSARLAANPALATGRLGQGATRQSAKPFFIAEIGRYIYAGDTALHIAASAYRREIVRKLLAAGADVGARNRRGAEPIHGAAVGLPGSPAFDP